MPDSRKVDVVEDSEASLDKVAEECLVYDLEVLACCLVRKSVK